MDTGRIFAGEHHAVVGLGRSGLPAARALVRYGADVVVWDDRAELREAAAAEGLMVAEPEMTGLTSLVLSPGIPHRLPAPHRLAAQALAAGVPILSDAELLYRAVRATGSRARFAGITGTNGKSTTTALLAHVLSEAGSLIAVGGNLETATTFLALPLLGDQGVYVLEMSSYMLERIVTLRFDVAAMLNLSVDHLDRHGDMAGYARAKRAIFDRQGPGCTAVVGTDDAASAEMADGLTNGSRVVRVSATTPADVFVADGMLMDHTGDIAALAEAPALPGAHNGQNAAAVAAMALALGVSRRDIARGLISYDGLPHRMERIAIIDGVGFVNDSKATNADSTARALACFDRVIWIAGGTAKADGIEPLAPLFGHVAIALLIGKDAPVLADTLRRHGVPYRELGTLAAAVDAAHDIARPGNTVLLSPACASWDQFTGFAQRGDMFRDQVLHLARQDAH